VTVLTTVEIVVEKKGNLSVQCHLLIIYWISSCQLILRLLRFPLNNSCGRESHWMIRFLSVAVRYELESFMLTPYVTGKDMMYAILLCTFC
jgi:heme/copper-type cytochrome/quinol oxidase subunit 4